MVNLVCLCSLLTSIFKKPGRDISAQRPQIAGDSGSSALSDCSVSPNRLNRSGAPSPLSREAIMETCHTVNFQWPDGPRAGDSDSSAVRGII